MPAAIDRQLDDERVRRERRRDERRESPEQPERQRPRRRIPDRGHHVEERVVEHGAEVARDVRVLPVPDEVARGHEDPAVVRVAEGRRQGELQDDAQQEQAAVRRGEPAPRRRRPVRSHARPLRLLALSRRGPRRAPHRAPSPPCTPRRRRAWRSCTWRGSVRDAISWLPRITRNTPRTTPTRPTDGVDGRERVRAALQVAGEVGQHVQAKGADHPHDHEHCVEAHGGGLDPAVRLDSCAAAPTPRPR